MDTLSYSVSNQTVGLPKVRPSDRAVRRYHQRGKPAHNVGCAGEDLETAITAGGELVSNPPSWMLSARTEALFVVVGGSVALPVACNGGARRIAVSCIADNSISTHERDGRTLGRGRRQQARRAKR